MTPCNRLRGKGCQSTENWGGGNREEGGGAEGKGRCRAMLAERTIASARARCA